MVQDSLNLGHNKKNFLFPRAREWANERTSERANERTSERTSEWPSTYVLILCCSKQPRSATWKKVVCMILQRNFFGKITTDLQRRVSVTFGFWFLNLGKSKQFSHLHRMKRKLSKVDWSKHSSETLFLNLRDTTINEADYTKNHNDQILQWTYSIDSNHENQKQYLRLKDR